MNPSLNPETPALRLVHLSDVHVTTRPLGWRWQDVLSKRLTSWLNLRWLGRGFRFRRTDKVLAALLADLRQRPPDRVVFSGDATALGFESEMVRAAQLLGVNGEAALAGLAVPGNHDYGTPFAAASGLFERCFAPWQTGERIDGHTYPFAQRVGHVWLVGVNSSTATSLPWDASGRVGKDQLQRLEQLLGRLEGGPRILVTHYPVCLANGRSERRKHGLRDLADLITVAEHGGINLWLHGHRHDWYHHARSLQAAFPLICAGSATQSGRWSYGDYTITSGQLRAVRRVFDPEQGSFMDGESFELTLKKEE